MILFSGNYNLLHSKEEADQVESFLSFGHALQKVWEAGHFRKGKVLKLFKQFKGVDFVDTAIIDQIKFDESSRKL